MHKTEIVEEIKKSTITAVWFVFLTFPIMVIRVNTIHNTIEWRWDNMVMVALGSFVLSFLWRYFMDNRKAPKPEAMGRGVPWIQNARQAIKRPLFFYSAIALLTVFAVIFPFFFSRYQVNIMTTALIYVMLGLGLNIVVGLAGLLDLGYVAFYAVGAYSYALLHLHYGLNFWICLPLGAGLAALFGIILGFPVLRLRGDYLAIVTLGFGEIIRLILENWNEFSKGPSGIAEIPRPPIPGVELSLSESSIFLYFLVIVLTLFTIFVVNRLRNSRIGRAWIALREDEIACQAMGVNKTATKLTAFALGATWAGMAGVIFAAKTTFINPASFTFLESAIILSIVVLGGMGSIVGVIASALILILLPEYLRAFSEYRMLLFGAVLVIMMVFRPQGLVSTVRQTYQFKGLKKGKEVG